MSFDYAAKAKNAERLIAKFGRAETLRRTIAETGAYSAATSQVTPPTLQSYPCKLIAFDYKKSFIDGTLIRQGDKQGYMSAPNVPLPLAGDTATWNGSELSVVAVKDLAPAGVSVLYEVQLR
ncbi:MAG: hypothetical protein ACRDAM_06080 [Casimicrobium sp.]